MLCVFPLRYSDPSGHCAENGDEACWSAYEQAIGILGEDFAFLAQWSWADLQRLLTWLNKGILFEGEWTSNTMMTALLGLDSILNAIGDWETMAAVLGLSAGGTLTLIVETSRDGSVARAASGEIIFGENPSLTLFLHEIGHIVDYNLEAILNKSSIYNYWSETGLIGLGWSQGVYTYPLGFIDKTTLLGLGMFSAASQSNFVYDEASNQKSFSTDNPVEDFADMFAAWVMKENNIALPNGWNPISIEREFALITALSEVTQ